VIGVDEVGRGALAGDVFACASLINYDCIPEGLMDSKLLRKTSRNRLFDQLNKSNNIFKIGIATIAEIEKHNILQATMMAMARAIDDLLSIVMNSSLDIIVIVDGNAIPNVQYNKKINLIPVIGGDKKFIEISAASVIAKVSRDQMMSNLSIEFPMYHWDQNCGYGVPEHIKAIRQFGPCKYHRISFLSNIMNDKKI